MINVIKGIILMLVGTLTGNSKQQNLGKWKLQNGDKELLQKHNLYSNDIVFEIGGYKGDFTNILNDRHNCQLYVFEPVKEFYNVIKKRFHDKNIHLFNFGLSDKDQIVEIGISNGSSSTSLKNCKTERIELKNITTFIDTYKIKNISLMQINIEGGEYSLLSSLIQSGAIKKVEEIQVQFHNISDDSEKKMKTIIKKLKKTHNVKYHYPFVWTGFEKK